MTRSLSELKNQIHLQGFLWMEAIHVDESPGYERFQDWLRRGYHGSMAYLEERKSAYQHPQSILAEVQTIIMLAIPYTPATSLRKQPLDDSIKTDEGYGRIASYASGGDDYHDVIHTRLRTLKKWMTENYPGSAVRGVVDTAPILERDFAAAAGLGWIGKNTLLLRRDAGSYFFLAALLTDVTFEDARSIQRTVAGTDHCGTCTACLDACPTQAFPEPRVLNASKCISYLTIEHRGAIDEALRTKMGNWILGCDICQQVCPWNRMAVTDVLEEFTPSSATSSVDLLELLRMDELTFRSQYRSTPLWRPKLKGMQRNAMIALANQKHRPAIAAIQPFLSSLDPVLSETAAWALKVIADD